MTNINNNQTELSPAQQDELIKILQTRFVQNPNRHHGINWADVQTRLLANPAKIQSLLAMEQTGGEPDVVGYDDQTGEFIFCDCSIQSPKGRVSLCYDRAALDGRKENKPLGSALEMAAEMGIELLDEAQYRHLQQLGEFDTKTSSWVQTPPEVRKLGGALFCDRRYGHVFTYHNGAESYYAARGFRGSLRI